MIAGYGARMRILAGAGTHDGSTPHAWTEHLRVADLSCGTYFLAAGAMDPQEPHSEDELYLCTGGERRCGRPPRAR